MANFLFCWELGGGLGHVGRLAPLAQRLASRGHTLSVALREPRHGPEHFPSQRLFAAPQESPARTNRIVEPSTFADILHNAGAGDRATLNRVVAAWRAIFDEAKPDVLVLDFSPLALLASQGFAMTTILLATGHACPPDVAPLPDCCPWRNSYSDRLARTEQRVLESLNQQLAAQDQPLLERVAQLFTRVAANWLTTFPELDHYPLRPAGQHEYVGVWSDLSAVKPHWPHGDGPRIFAYLKTAPLAPLVLAELERRKLPSIAFVPDAEAMGLPIRRGSVRVSREPIDVGVAARECDMAILHSGHNTTARVLLAGKAVLALPLSGEQKAVASNVVRLGAGEWLHPERIESLPQFLEQIMNDDRYRTAAGKFSQRYAAWTPERQLQQVVDKLDEMASGSIKIARQ
jgi:UDP:flavonoid glycosyltransferase YjiC (YdhE family)